MYGAAVNQESYQLWPAGIRAAWDQVLVTVNSHRALGGATKAITGSSYSVELDGSRFALLGLS